MSPLILQYIVFIFLSYYILQSKIPKYSPQNILITNWNFFTKEIV